MRCARCNAENPAGMRFCGQCGDPLDGAVAPGFAEPRIDSLAPALRRTPGGRGRPAGEIKQVTALFCDIVGSAELTERLGAERMHELVSEFLDTALAEVRRYEGTAPQFGRDGFMALFGAPVAQEDHVRRALLAALAIRRVLGGEGGEAGDKRLSLSLRIGIHTGPVVFAPVADSFRMETAIGDTANVAARLQQAAEPGAILLSEATREAAQGYVRAEPVGPLALKGKAEPITAYRLLGVSHRRAALDPTISARRTSFVGRNDDLALLSNWQRQVETGQGRAVAIVGEPGIGKSRLLAEFRRRLAGDRVTWVEGRCQSYSTAIPYWLALDLLRSNCGIVETDSADAIAGKVRSGLGEVGIDPGEDSPILLHLLGVKDVGGAPMLSSPESVKAKTFDILSRLSIEGSRRRPLVFVLEDLHWVDKISEEFFSCLAENIGEARILLLAAHRPEYRPPWADKPYARQIALRPLSRSDSLHVVRSAHRGERLADRVAGEILAKGDGNPFFLEQLALHAGEAGDLRPDLLVPGTIHDVVMARIDRLPEESKELLQTAAVIGREFPLRLLRAVSRDPGSVAARLNELKRWEFVDERLEADGTAYVFRHWLTQEAAYGSLLERHRRGYHAEIGRALEALYEGRADEVAELLALHFGRSGAAEKAVDYAILAAEKAQRRWANNDALSYFNDALRRLDPLPDTEPNRLRRIDAVLKQVEVKFALGQQVEHLTALENIGAAVEAAGDPRRRAIWHCWTGYLHGLTGGSAALAIEHCREAAAIAAASRCDDIEGVHRTPARCKPICSAASCAKRSERAIAPWRSSSRKAIRGGQAGRSGTRRRPRFIWASGRPAFAYCRRVLAHAGTARRPAPQGRGPVSPRVGPYLPRRHRTRAALLRGGPCPQSSALRRRHGQGVPRIRRDQSRPARCRHRRAGRSGCLVRPVRAWSTSE